MFFIVGASGSGKTSCLSKIKSLLPDYKIYDFDDIGVPPNADKKWRQETSEKWLHQLVHDKDQDKICLFGQVVLGEILCCPSAKNINKLHIFLLDCSDPVRITRLKNRNPHEINQHTLNWASWLRIHHLDPLWQQSVIKYDCSGLLNFDRLEQLSDWSMVCNNRILDTTKLSIDDASKTLVNWIKIINDNIFVRMISIDDIPLISKKLTAEKMNKPLSLFSKYFQEQQDEKRIVFIATDKDKNHYGYATVLWQSKYPEFSKHNIPEINDLNVIPSQRSKGIGSLLLDHAESIISKKHDFVGLGFGLYGDYGSAQNLYVQRGYVPNKIGATYDYINVVPGNNYCMDDELILWLLKRLR